MKHKHFLITVIFLVVFILSVQIIWGQVPQTMSYQGVLMKAKGTLVQNGQYTLTFKLYDAAEGGKVLWSETQTIRVEDGLFNAALGSVNSLDIPFDQPYWLSVTIGDGEEVSRRMQLTSSAYSLQAQTVADKAITSQKIADGQVVRSINSVTDNVKLTAGENVTITQEGDELVISASVGPDHKGDIAFQGAKLAKAKKSWLTEGNTGTDPTTDFLGTTDNQPLVIRTNGAEAMRVDVAGNVGLGTPSPNARLHVTGGDVLMDGGGYNFAPPGGTAADLAFFRGGASNNGVFLFKRFPQPTDPFKEHTILDINSPPGEISLTDLEATLALVRGNEPNLELVDFYNNGYASETQYGIRMIKEGTGSYQDFVFDYFDGNTDVIETEVLRLKPSGNVGIGTTNPQAKLTVGGNEVRIEVVAGSNAFYTIRRNGVPNAKIGIDQTNDILQIENKVATGDNSYIARQHIFKSSGHASEYMRIHSSGNVGIGTTTPSAILHTFKNVDSGEFNGLRVQNPSAVGPALSTIRIGESFGGFSQDETGYVVYYNSGSGSLQEEEGTASTFAVQAAGGATGGLSLAARASGAPIRFFAGGGLPANQHMRIEANGKVGIGTLSPNHPLEMGSGAHVTSGGVWTNVSSREHKDNIRELTLNEAMEALDRLEPVQFNYKIDEEDNYLGFIAEDVPAVVASKDRKGLSPMDIVAVLTKVVQAQQRKIEALEVRFNERK